MQKLIKFAIIGLLVVGLLSRIPWHTPASSIAAPVSIADTLTPTTTNSPTTTTTPSSTTTATASTTATTTPTSSSTASPTVTATGTVTSTLTATPSATATALPGSSNPTTAYFAEGYTGSAAVNGRASFSETLNILNPGTLPALVTITYYLQGSSTPIAFTRTVSPTTVLREVVNTDVGADKFVAAQVSSPQTVFVTRTMSRVAPDNSRLDGSATRSVSAPARTWGFPEGYTGVSFQEYLTILNPNSVQANVTVVLAPQAASSQGAKTLTFTVPALSRATENIRSLNADSSAKSVGMIISSDQPIVPERVLYFGAGAGSGKFGSTVSRGISTAATQEYIAYGTSSGLSNTAGVLNAQGNQAFITLLNPTVGGASVQVTAIFYDASGHVLGQSQPVTVAGGTRQTIIANNVLGSNAVTPFSVLLNATGAIEAESAQYYAGSPNIGMHPGVDFPAQPQGNSNVYLSDLETTLTDGTSVNRDVFIFNPGNTQLQVAATYFGNNGATVHNTYVVPAGGITSVDADQDSSASIPPGALGAEFTVTGGTGSIIVYAQGRTGDGLSATEDVGVPAF